MNELDIPVAKLQHQRWRMRLRSFLQGEGSLTESEAVSHRDCDLGKWIYSSGLKEHGSLPEMQDLEKIHAELHSLIKKIIQFKNSGDPSKADEEFTKVGDVSNEIMGLLDKLEGRV